MSANLKLPRCGRGGAGIALTLAVLVFSFIALSSMVGCNGHNDPVRPDQSGAVYRSAQAFSTPEEWGDSYTVDSSTSTWTHADDTSGDIASVDGDVDPLVTAFVRDEPFMGGVLVGLTLRDRDWEVVYEDDFSYRQDYRHCQDPAVEVTYDHRQSEEGIVTVHIVWAEEFPNQWEIVYRQLQFDPSNDWELLDEDVYYKVTDTVSTHETQPDLCVHDPSGDLYAVFRAEVSGPTRYAIYAVKLPYDDGWDPEGWVSAGTVALLYTTVKEHPSIDAGLSSRISDGDPMELVQVVWSQPVDGLYHVFYNYWEIANYAHPPYNIRISPEIDNGHQILPKIEVLPNSSGLNEAVIAWDCECAHQGGACPQLRVIMVATPFIGPDYDYPVCEVDHSRCPDLAAYQGEQDGYDGLIALSRHFPGEGAEGWLIRASAYHVQLVGETFEFGEVQHTDVPAQLEWYTYWPFSGLTICLRNPDNGNWIYHTLGMGWTDDSYTAYLAEGDTTP